MGHILEFLLECSNFIKLATVVMEHLDRSSLQPTWSHRQDWVIQTGEKWAQGAHHQWVIWVLTEAKERGLCHVCPRWVATEELLLAGHTLLILGALFSCHYSEEGMGTVSPAAYLTLLLRDFQGWDFRAESSCVGAYVAWQGDQEERSPLFQSS